MCVWERVCVCVVLFLFFSLFLFHSFSSPIRQIQMEKYLGQKLKRFRNGKTFEWQQRDRANRKIPAHEPNKVQMNNSVYSLCFSVWLCLPDRHFHGCFRRLFQDVRLCPVMWRCCLLCPTGFHPWSSSNRRYINVNTRPYNNYYSSITRPLIGNIILPSLSQIDEPRWLCETAARIFGGFYAPLYALRPFWIGISCARLNRTVIYRPPSFT